MQVWPPKELPITKLTDETRIRGVTMRDFKSILKAGFAKMYAEDPTGSLAKQVKVRAVKGRGRCWH